MDRGYCFFVQSDSAAKAIAEFEPLVQSRESYSGGDDYTVKPSG